MLLVAGTKARKLESNTYPFIVLRMINVYTVVDYTSDKSAVGYSMIATE